MYRDCKDQQVVQECLVQSVRKGLEDQRGQKDREDLKVFLDQLVHLVHRDMKEILSLIKKNLTRYCRHSSKMFPEN